MRKTLYSTLLALLSAGGLAPTLLAQCPQITCPSNVTTNAGSGSCAASVSYTTPVGTNPCGGTTTATFNFTGAQQSFTVPSGVTTITVDAQGAQGGANGGLGGRAVATIPVTPGEVLEVWVGGRPTQEIGPGGFNGGGAVVIEPCGSGPSYSWPGGGASDIRRGSGYANRLIVAGGGGGQGWSTGLGGAGGGTTGTDGAASWITGTNGKGGTPSAGGLGGFYSGNGQSSPNGTLGVGGNGSPLNTYCTGGGGGGGYYGGGGGYVSAGGGGSSYVAYPGNTSTSTTAGYRAGNGVITITYSGGGSATTTQTAGLSSGATFPVGTTSNTFTVNDGQGNSASCTFSVTVVDAQAPILTCPANANPNTDPGQCTAVVTYTAPTGTDNCSGVSTAQTGGLTSGSAFPIGISTVTYQSTDAAGLTAACSFTVTVVDAEAPTVNCPANVSVTNDAGLCTALVNYSGATAADNCSGVSTSLSSGLASGSAFPTGTSTQTYTATDASGNTSTCAFTVTVTDTEAPTITCPTSFTVSPNAPNCEATVTYIAPSGVDNCPNASTALVSGLASGSTFPQGATTNTYQVTDGVGNSASCTFSITVDGTTTQTVAVDLCPGGSFTVGNHTYTQAGTYVDTLVGPNGCDLITTTNLSVVPLSTVVTQSGATLTASPLASTYQWLDCDNGMAPIAGATNQSFTPSMSGNYAVAVGALGCTDTSACTNVIVVGLEAGLGQEMRLFPNPSDGNVTVDFGGQMHEVEIRVLDLHGRVLHRQSNLNGIKANLDVRNLSPAVYLLEVVGQEGRHSFKMVIE